MTEDLAIAAARLAEVLTAENAALAALDLPRAGALLAEKISAADAFVAAHARFQAGPVDASPGASSRAAPASSAGGSAGMSAVTATGLSQGLSQGLLRGLSPGGAARRATPGAGTALPAQLRALVEENQRLLATAIAAQGRVVGIVASALKRAMQTTAPRYGGGGRTLAPPLRAVAISARA